MRVERDVAVPMRDGAVLRADVYRPDSDAPVPAVVSRTPYNRSFRLTPQAAIDPERSVDAGFALVVEDVRGLNGSEGEFHPFLTEGRDGYDTVEWVAAQPWAEGGVGMAGRSYTGVAQWMAAAERPPHLRAIVPVVTGSDFYDGWVYQGGAFQLGFNLFWIHLMTPAKRKISLDEQFRHLPLRNPPLIEKSPFGGFYSEWLDHPTYDDYWRTLAIRHRYERVQVPACSVGGWYDIFLRGTLENFSRGREEAGSEEARAAARLVVGPWAHGSTYGPYPDHTYDVFGGVELDVDELALRFFDHHLNGSPNGVEAEAPVRIFVMGENRWRDEQAWPLSRARAERWYLREGGCLSPEGPADEAPDEYEYDPHDAAPTIGGPTLLPAKLMRTNSGPLDQRKVETRADVLTYSSEPLARPLEVTGPLRVKLYAATSAPDTDFVAKLCDVQPDGSSRILAEGIRRARFRESYGEPRLVEAGAVEEYEIDLVATSNVFLEGHAIRVSVTSSSFPRFDRNTNTGNELGVDGPDALRSARQAVFHDAGRPSFVELPVVPR